MSTSKKIVLKSSVIESFEVGEAAALESQTNCHMTMDNCADHDIHIPNANNKILAKLREILDLLVHASQCRSALCQYRNCSNVKDLFRHGILRETRASGGCLLCKKMWHLLLLQARACMESQCHIPRCRDLKEHLRQLQQQSDGQRAAELNNSWLTNMLVFLR